MEWHDIRTALSRLAPPFPIAAAQEARRRWDELAPYFVAELERVAAGGSTLVDEINGEYDGLFSFAVYLAAEKRDSRAYAPLVRVCHCSDERADELFGDDVGNQLGRMLASVCDGDVAPIKALAEDRVAGLWCRYAAVEDAAVQGEKLSHRLSAIIRRRWIAQYARPLPLPTVIDSHSGDPILMITDHYRVENWDDLAAALQTQSDIQGDRACGWARLFACADGQTRQSVSINLGKSEDRIELFYKTQNCADQGRPWFEALAGESVEFAGRVLSDPRSAMKNPPAGKPGSSATTVSNLPPEALAEAVEKLLRRTYANWSDEPIPALGGKTPRQAIATATGRERVRGLLRSYAAGEKVQAAQQGRREISYAFLWEALGLDGAAE